MNGFARNKLTAFKTVVDLISRRGYVRQLRWQASFVQVRVRTGPARYLLPLCMAMMGLTGTELTSSLTAQSSVGAADVPQKVLASEKENLAPAPAKVVVKPIARDEEIRQRLQSVFDATGWFTDPKVEVEEGVVFINGRSETDELKKWAGDLARNTQDVVAVANRMEVSEPSIWDFSPAWNGMLILWRDFIHSAARQGTQAQSSRIVPVPKPSASRRIFCTRNAVPEAA